jgi:hypothetical protein
MDSFVLFQLFKLRLPQYFVFLDFACLPGIAFRDSKFFQALSARGIKQVDPQQVPLSCQPTGESCVLAGFDFTMLF